MEDIIKLVEHNGYKIEITRDENMENPNNYLIAQLAYDHKQFYVDAKVNNLLVKAKAIHDHIGAWMQTHYVILVAAYIHSGVSLSIFSDDTNYDRFDTSYSGYLLIPHDYTNDINMINVANDAIEIWNKYLSGDGYQYRIYTENTCDCCGNTTEIDFESCNGFLDIDKAIDDAKSIIDSQYESKNNCETN